MTKQQLLKRLNYPSELEELISEGALDLIDNLIVIKFLDSQLFEVEGKSKINSTNGSKGGRPKKNPIESEIKPKLNPIESESKAIREYKIKENKIKEDKIKENIINNAVFVFECKNSTQWIEVTAMQNKVPTEIVNLFLNTFENHLITMQEQKKTVKEYKEHFTHWMKKQDLSNFREKIVGKTNQI